MSRLSRVTALVGGLVLLGLAGLAGYIAAPYFFHDDPADATAALERISAQINTQLPTEVDAATRLDRTSVDGRTLQYEYALLPPLSDRIDPASFESTYGPRLTQTICSTEQLSALLARGFDIRHRYRLDGGGSVGNITVTRSDCGV